MSRPRTVLAGLAGAALLGWMTWRLTDGIAARETWDDRVTGTRFRLLGPATFMMGTPEDELQREAQEALHEVTLTRAFYIAQTEVTQAQWERSCAKTRASSRSAAQIVPWSG